MHQADTPLFLPFFLSTKETSQATRLDTNATNRRAARAVAKNIPTTKQHPKKHTYTYIYPPTAWAYPRVCGWVRGRVCRDSSGVFRCECHPLRVLRVMPVCGVRVGKCALSASDPTGARFVPVRIGEMRRSTRCEMRPTNKRPPTSANS